MKQVPPHFHTHELTHRYAGNGFFFLQQLDDSYCRVASFIEDRIARVETAHVDMLSKFTLTEADGSMKDFLIKPERISAIRALRGDLESGRQTIRWWHQAKA